RVITSDMYGQRLTIAKGYGIDITLDASRENVVEKAHELTEGRGVDAAIVAVAGNGLIQPALDATRPGGRGMLFAQTQRSEAKIDPASICVDEKMLLGSYSASVDLQEASVDFVFNGGVDLAKLISHRFPLEKALDGLHLAAHPQPDSMKIVIA